jgi:hypothetical protein
VEFRNSHFALSVNLKWEIGCFSYFVAIVVYVDNAVNQSADESSNMIGRISKQESNQRLAYFGFQQNLLWNLETVILHCLSVFNYLLISSNVS